MKAAGRRMQLHFIEAKSIFYPFLACQQGINCYNAMLASSLIAIIRLPRLMNFS